MIPPFRRMFTVAPQIIIGTAAAFVASWRESLLIVLPFGVVVRESVHERETRCGTRHESDHEATGTHPKAFRGEAGEVEQVDSQIDTFVTKDASNIIGLAECSASTVNGSPFVTKVESNWVTSDLDVSRYCIRGSNVLL
jgi:hypothetical protein